MPRTKGAIHKDRTVGARRLRGPLKRIFKKLASAGVPKGAMPTSDFVIEMLPRLINWDAVDAWAAQLAAGSRPPVIVKVPRKS